MRPTLARLILGVVPLALVGSVLSACGGMASATGTITVYSGQHLETTQALASAFEQKTGIKVMIRSADEATLANQLMVEGSHSPADVFLAGNSPALEAVSAKGLFTTIDPTTLADVPSADSSPTGTWVGVSARVACLAYSTTYLTPNEVPTSVLDLANPTWRGKIGIAPTESDFQPIVTSVERSYGHAATLKWLEGLKANSGSHLYPDNEALISAINRGAIELGVLNQYYWYRLNAELGRAGMHSALALFHDRDAGYVLDISGAGVLKSSKQQANAQKFVAFLVSAEGQSLIANSGSFEYPLRTSAPTPAGEPPLASLHPAPLSVTDLGTGASALALLQEAQLL